MSYIFKDPIIAIFKERKKRFFSYFYYKDTEIVAHCLNTGKMAGLLKPGLRCILSKKEKGLPYLWEAVEIDNTWVGVNTIVPNFLVKDLLIKLYPKEIFKKEKLLGNFKPDFISENYIVEVKHVHWKINNIAYFPDTPTLRGYNQIKFFKNISNKKFLLIYIIQRNDVFNFSIADFIQKELSDISKDVKTLAFNCNVTEKNISIKAKINVIK